MQTPSSLPLPPPSQPARRRGSCPFVTEEGTVVPLRSAATGEWCWQSKRARRLIRLAFDSTHNIQTALSVYDALCEIASDAASDAFVTTHAWIQQFSGVAVSTIKKCLANFVRLGLLHISTPAFRAPSTYVLLEIENDGRLPAPTGHALVNETPEARVAASEECLKKFEETNPAPDGARERSLNLNLPDPKPRATNLEPRQTESPPPAAPPAPPAPHDELLAAFATLDGSPPHQVTASAWGAATKALKEVRAVSPALTVTEIRRRAAHYRAHLPTAVISAPALAKHWGRCDQPPPTPPRSATPVPRLEAPVRRLDLSAR